MKLEQERLSACGICGTTFTNEERLVQVKDPFKVSDKTFTYMECSRCGTWIQNPRPVLAEMARFYDADFVLDVASRRRSWLGKLSLTLRDRKLYFSHIKWMLRHMKDGCCYLDYSAGDGGVIRLVKAQRADVAIRATEFSRASGTSRGLYSRGKHKARN